MSALDTQRVLIIGVVLALITSPALAGAAVAQDDGPPSPPATYYGEVTVDGDSPDSPVTVEAVVGNEVRDSIETDADGNFGGAGAFDEKLTVPGESGEQVTFVVGSEETKTVDWESAANREVTLEITDSTVVDLALSLDSSSLEVGDSTDGTVTATFANGTETDVSSTATISSADEDIASVSGTTVTADGDGTATIEATYEGVAATAELAVESAATGGGTPADDDADDEDEDDDTDEQPTTEEPTEPEPEVADSPDAIEELVPETVELPSDVEPTRAEVNDVSSDSDGAGATVTFSEESATESIEFSEGASGSVSVVELDREPESTGSAPGQSVSVTQITVPEEATDSSATIRNRVPRDRIESIDAAAEDLTVTRYNDEAGEWQSLDTEVLEATDSAVRLEAETPGFSYFAVTAIDAPTAALDAPAEVEVGEEIVFDASESMDDDTEIVSYDWTVDGEAVEGAETLSHTFESAGEFTVEVAVENDAGKTNTTSTQVVVLEQGTVTTTAVETTVGPETTTTETPGFTMGLALVALLGAALLVLRRSD